MSRGVGSDSTRLGARLRGIVGNKLLTDSVIYVVARVLKHSIPFLLLPILTRYLTPEDYGVISTFEVLLAIFVVLVGLSLRGAVSLAYFREESEDFPRYVGNVLMLQSANCALVAAVVMIGKPLFAAWSGFPEDWLIVVVLVAYCRALNELRSAIWQVERRPIPFGVFHISLTLLNVGLSILLVVPMAWDWRGRVVGVGVAALAFAVPATALLVARGGAVLRVDRRQLRDALRYGVPLIPTALSGLIVAGIDRLFLNSMVGLAATGVYTVGYYIGGSLGVLATAFNQAWVPYLFGRLGTAGVGSKIKLVRFTYAYFAVIALGAGILTVSSPFILGWLVGREFAGAAEFVGWIAAGYCGLGMYYMVVNYVIYVHKTHIVSIISVSVALLNAVLNYFLIGAYGPIGAAQATAISFAASFLLTWWASVRLYPMPWMLTARLMAARLRRPRRRQSR